MKNMLRRLIWLNCGALLVCFALVVLSGSTAMTMSASRHSIPRIEFLGDMHGSTVLKTEMVRIQIDSGNVYLGHTTPRDTASGFFVGPQVKETAFSVGYALGSPQRSLVPCLGLQGTGEYAFPLGLIVVLWLTVTLLWFRFRRRVVQNHNLIPCTQCGHPALRGSVRCVECGHSTSRA